jgi:hypothetical protein
VGHGQEQLAHVVVARVEIGGFLQVGDGFLELAGPVAGYP